MPYQGAISGLRPASCHGPKGLPWDDQADDEQKDMLLNLSATEMKKAGTLDFLGRGKGSGKGWKGAGRVFFVLFMVSSLVWNGV